MRKQATEGEGVEVVVAQRDAAGTTTKEKRKSGDDNTAEKKTTDEDEDEDVVLDEDEVLGRLCRRWIDSKRKDEDDDEEEDDEDKEEEDKEYAPTATAPRDASGDAGAGATTLATAEVLILFECVYGASMADAQEAFDNANGDLTDAVHALSVLVDLRRERARRHQEYLRSVERDGLFVRIRAPDTARLDADPELRAYACGRSDQVSRRPSF